MIKRTMMALALALGLTGTFAVAGPAQQAEAGDDFRAGVSITYGSRHCDACRAVVRYERQWIPAQYQTRRVFVGYDHCGNPVFQLQRVLVSAGHYRNVPVTYYTCSGRADRYDRRDRYDRYDRYDRRDHRRARSRFSFQFRF